MKIKSKIFLAYFIAGTILTIFGVTSEYIFSKQSLESEIFSHLNTIADAGGNEIKLYLNEQKKDISMLANSPLVRKGFGEKSIQDVRDIKETMKNKAKSVASQIEAYITEHPEMTIFDLQDDPDFQKIAVQPVGTKGYTFITDYETLICRFHPNPDLINLNWDSIAKKLPGFWSIIGMTEGGKSVGGFYDWEEADGSITKKYMYAEVINIKTADDVGLVVSATTYLDEYNIEMDIMKDLEDYLIRFNEFYHYSDLFLVNDDGDVWWSAMQRGEWGTNLNEGAFKDTILAQTYREVLQSNHMEYSDYAFYSTYEEPKAFIAAPIYRWNNNTFAGVIIVEVGTYEINEIVNHSFFVDESTKIYLIGSDLLMRSDIQNSQESTTLKQKIDTANSRQCFGEDIAEHEAGHTVEQFTNYENVNVVGSHIYIPEMDWCLLAEIEVSKALVPVSNALLIGIILAVIIIFFVFVVSRRISNTISGPILKLQKATDLAEKGNLDLKINIKTKDELGALGKSFNKMILAIKKSKAEISKKVKEQTHEIMQHKLHLENQQRAVLNILEDVAKEKEITAKERDKINTILYSIGDGVFVVDKELKIKVFNKMAATISGYTEKEVFNKPYNEVLKFISEKDKSDADSFIKEAIKTGTQQSLVKDSILIRKNKSSVPVANSAAPLKNTKGNVIGCIVVFRDVTKEREVEKMKSEFVSIASHQLRTPLTVMGWELEMMNKGFFGKFTDKQLGEFYKLDKSHKHMLELVNDLLDASRIDAGRLELKFEKIQLDEIIKTAITNVSAIAKKKKIKVTSPRFSKKSPFVNVDSSKISEVIQNLIENAVKYTPDGGKVDVSYKKDKNNKYVIFGVVDNGIGIPAKAQKHMFTKFFRADNAVKAKKTGTGLGLYISKTIVEKSDGKIWFESKKDKGTKFFIKLPITKK